LFKSLFGRKDHPTEESRDWTVAKASDQGKPLIIRFRSTPPTGINQTNYRHMMAISWKYEPSSDAGMPSPKESDRMKGLEDLLNQAFEPVQQAFLTVVVTGNGVREWQWYSRDPAEFMSLLNKALAGHSQFPITVSKQDDPEWEAYSQFQQFKD
jgi:hypothetical protein